MISSTILDADYWQTLKTYDATQYAAAINTIPMQLNVLNHEAQLGQAGLPKDVSSLTTAVKSSTPTVTAEQFDPNGEAFTDALDRTKQDCVSGGFAMGNYVVGG